MILGVSVSSSEDKLSTGKAVAISIVITFIITLAIVVTALISIIITCLYYKCRYELKAKVEVDYNDNLRRNMIMIQKNPAYVASPTEIVKVVNYEYISLKQETT